MNIYIKLIYFNFFLLIFIALLYNLLLIQNDDTFSEMFCFDFYVKSSRWVFKNVWRLVNRFNFLMLVSFSRWDLSSAIIGEWLLGGAKVRTQTCALVWPAREQIVYVSRSHQSSLLSVATSLYYPLYSPRVSVCFGFCLCFPLFAMSFLHKYVL